ncbi:uncharacterized protein LOC118648891 [Monomorium pharaonis]|uniref:uncharacterized protein LOC118648891 n=1 Tax=Monomorium pharaonis TaxID=307658 RepID=UPI0017461AE7|nr:uncharacterized protein LOC118648891 [Monomorium pharaonis]
MFATSLLEMAKMQSNTESTVSSISDEGDSNESLFKWSHAATLFLVEEYRRQEKNLTSGKISQKKGWNNIALALSTKGYNVTGSQCISKFHGMKRTYKSIKDHNSKSGNNPRSWPYMEVMESLLGERPFMSPPAIASSSNTCHLKNVLTPSSANTLSDVDLTKPNPRKRKAQEETLTIAKAITQSRQLAENNKEQRHKERMDFRKEMLGFMQKMLEKL